MRWRWSGRARRPTSRRSTKEYVATLRRRGLVDDTGLYALATEAASQGAPPTVAGVPVALFGIYDLPAMQAALVAALAADRPFAAFLPSSSGVCRYAAPALAFLESLGLQVDGDRDARSAPDGCASAGIGVPAGIGAPTAFANGADVSQTQVNIVSVADDVAERRAAVAEVLRAAADVAFHDIAVIVADRSGRDRLARALQAHDIPVAARGADDGVSARACRLLLDCLLPVAGRPLRRDAVIDLAATAPRLDAVADAAAGAATVALWDTLSRRARIVADDEWYDRLRRLEHSLSQRRARETEAAVAVETGATVPNAAASSAPSPPDKVAAAASLREFVGRLAGRRRRLLASRTWPEATHHLIDAARTLCGVPPDDPALSALAELADVALVDDAGPRESFGGVARRVLASLESATDRRVGRDGVAVLSPQQLRGLAFRVVVFCDLAEGGFPRGRRPIRSCPTASAAGSPPPVARACRAAPTSLPKATPCLLWRVTRPSSGSWRSTRVSTHRPGGRGCRRARSWALPASWPAARWAEELDRDGGLGGLVRRVAGGRGEPVDLRDVDLGVLLAGRGALGELDFYAGAVLGSARAERAAAAACGRRRGALGPYDGVLSAGHAAQAAAGVFAGPISPSALEQYLSCPFAFYLRYVLGLEVPDDPEESLSIEPVDLGSLAHEILQGAYAAAAVGVPSAGARAGRARRRRRRGVRPRRSARAHRFSAFVACAGRRSAGRSATCRRGRPMLERRSRSGRV